MYEHDYKRYPELTNTQLEQLQFSSPHQQITEDFTAVVVKVHDGDTITLRTDFRDFDFPLRILDIDAPELSEGGEEARQWLNGKCLHQDVQVQIDANNRVGKYGRLLGRVFFSGLSLAEEMLSLGLVSEFGRKKESEIPDTGVWFRGGQWW